MSEKDLATRQAAQHALAAQFDYGDQAGAGFENQTQDDHSIPFLGILQATSPQVAGEASERIKGACAGMLINTVTGEMFDGDAGIFFQPVATNHVFVEWVPRNKGGGFVAVHQIDSGVVKAAKDASTKFGKYSSPAGNDLVETFYMCGLLQREADIQKQLETYGIGDPILIAFTSTKIKMYKAISTRLFMFKLPGVPKSPPLFAHRIHIKTKTETNDQGTFSNFIIQPAIANDVQKSLVPSKLADGPHPMIVSGAELCRAYSTGLVTANHAKQGVADGAAGKAGGSDIPF